jgi:hypothetical protein
MNFKDVHGPYKGSVSIISECTLKLQNCFGGILSNLTKEVDMDEKRSRGKKKLFLTVHLLACMYGMLQEKSCLKTEQNC